MRDVTRKPLRRDRRCSLCAVSLAVANRHARERQKKRRRKREKEERRRPPARKSVHHWRSQSNRVIETGHGAVSGSLLSLPFRLFSLPARFLPPRDSRSQHGRFRTISVTRDLGISQPAKRIKKQAALHFIGETKFYFMRILFHTRLASKKKDTRNA